MMVSLSSRIVLFRVITDKFKMRGVQIFQKSVSTIISLDGQKSDLQKISYRRSQNVRWHRTQFLGRATWSRVLAPLWKHFVLNLVPRHGEKLGKKHISLLLKETNLSVGAQHKGLW